MQNMNSFLQRNMVHKNSSQEFKDGFRAGLVFQLIISAGILFGLAYLGRF